MAVEKIIEIKIISADSRKGTPGEVWIAGVLVGSFNPDDIVKVRNVAIDIDNGAVDEDKINFSLSKGGINKANKRRKAISKKFSLPISKLQQLRRDRNPKISKTIRSLVQDEIDQIVIDGIKIKSKRALD
jgi:hypothetical protein